MILNNAKTTVEQLLTKKLTLATSESCTGGMLAMNITAISGSSDVFEYGVISYANRFKTSELGVLKQTLDEHGAVSEQVCRQMAFGAVQKSGADVAVATTGIAGPLGGSLKKPVGTVFIAVASNDNIICKKLSLKGDRNSIRLQATSLALELIQEFIAKYY